MDKLSRDLPTKQVQKLLDVCADSPRDKASLAIHNETDTLNKIIVNFKTIYII